jgi:hypothetical protein
VGSGAAGVEPDRVLLAGVDGEREDVGPGVMPDRVELPPLPEDLGGVDVCVEDPFLPGAR